MRPVEKSAMGKQKSTKKQSGRSMTARSVLMVLQAPSCKRFRKMTALFYFKNANSLNSKSGLCVKYPFIQSYAVSLSVQTK